MEAAIRMLGLKTADEVFAILEQYYPRQQIKPATQFFVEELRGNRSTEVKIMTTLKQVKQEIAADPENWFIYLMDFVDDFRRRRDRRMIDEPFEMDDERFDALLAATAEQLCAELKIEPPEWILAVPAVRRAWFVSGMESLKAIALVESPLPFRMRKIFVLENFLSRV